MMATAFSKLRAMMSMNSFAEPVVNPPAVNPDYRFWNPRRSYHSNEENVAYREGYRGGYNEGFGGAYAGSFRGSYDSSHTMGDQQGCQQGQNEQVGDSFQRGVQQGQSVGYNEAYTPAYDAANQAGYQRQFAAASNAAYSTNYGPDYDRYFAAAHDQAYQQASGDLYQQASDAAKQQEYDATYPNLSAQQYAQGTQDEQTKLAAQPLYVVSVAVEGADSNGVVPADQPLTLQIQLRNLAANSLSGSDFLLELVSPDSTQANVTVASQALVKDLQAQSQTLITEALGFQMTDASAGATTTLRFRLSYQGTVVTEQDVVVQTAGSVSDQ
jgi:hypothetical protein